MVQLKLRRGEILLLLSWTQNLWSVLFELFLDLFLVFLVQNCITAR